MQKIIISLCFLFFLVACQSDYSSSEKASETGFEQAEEDFGGDADLDLADRKIIKQGYLIFQTQSVKETRQQLLATAANHKAYIAADKSYKTDYKLNNVLTLRVPADKFEALLNKISEGVEYFDSKEVSAEDVTEQYLDLEARIKTKKELEARYRELFAQAQNVQEMLEIEKQIGELRSDIEVIEGRFKVMKNRVAYSTLEITFYEKIDSGTNFSGEFARAFSNGWDNLIYFLLFLTNLWTFFLFGSMLLAAILYWRKKRKQKKANQ
jgi:hypothetical protein